MLHTFRHILNNWCRLSLFHEIASFLEQRSRDEKFWLVFRRLVQDDERLCQCAGIAFLLAAQLFGARIPPIVRPLSTDALTPAMAFWVERYGVRSAIQNFSENKFSLFLHRLFISSRACWTEVRRRRLLLFRSPHVTVNLEGTRGWHRWSALCKQAAHSGRRLCFHITAGLRYAMEVPFWSIRIRTLPNKTTLQPPANVGPWAASAEIAGGVKE